MKMIKPTSRQLEYQSWKYGLFVHFGIRTFYEGHIDWDGKPMDVKAFNPAKLNCDQWIKTAKEAGMKYAVLTAKHHDGFANWPSKYTDYSVAYTPWKDGKGDVVQEFVDACRKYDMKVGLYYSPADASSTEFSKDEKKYDEYFINQAMELLEGYGEIDILWFDGCGSQEHIYDWKRIIGEIRKAQPNILIFNMGDPDFRWVGNEEGIAPSPCYNVVESVPFSIETKENVKLMDNEYAWLPTECDCKMRLNWFYSDSDEHTLKTLDELIGMYYYSIGRGSNLLLNIGPDRTGNLPQPDVEMLLKMKEVIDNRFKEAIATLSDCNIEEQKIVYRPTTPILINHVIIEEKLEEGEHVERFKIWAKPGTSDMSVVIYEGKTIGSQVICTFPTIRVNAVWIEIEEGSEKDIKALTYYYAK